MMNVDLKSDSLECPRCGKPVLVRRGNDHYHCLWCGFKRDISESQGLGEFLAVFLAIITALVIML